MQKVAAAPWPRWMAALLLWTWLLLMLTFGFSGAEISCRSCQPRVQMLQQGVLRLDTARGEAGSGDYEGGAPASGGMDAPGHMQLKDMLREGVLSTPRKLQVSRGDSHPSSSVLSHTLSEVQGSGGDTVHQDTISVLERSGGDLPPIAQLLQDKISAVQGSGGDLHPTTINIQQEQLPVSRYHGGEGYRDALQFRKSLDLENKAAGRGRLEFIRAHLRRRKRSPPAPSGMQLPTGGQAEGQDWSPAFGRTLRAPSSVEGQQKVSRTESKDPASDPGKGTRFRAEELRLTSTTFALTGDSAHNQAMVHWSGHNSSQFKRGVADYHRRWPHFFSAPETDSDWSASPGPADDPLGDFCPHPFLIDQKIEGCPRKDC